MTDGVKPRRMIDQDLVRSTAIRIEEILAELAREREAYARKSRDYRDEIENLFEVARVRGGIDVKVFKLVLDEMRLKRDAERYWNGLDPEIRNLFEAAGMKDW
jgi:hypothetical protein